jgi:wyosine [tRNA(Phe)-imidazoG37] synthetase (radical SAM superfamily)
MPTLNLLTRHDRTWRDNRYVYPVISRRSGGLSIGINLNPDKRCNFDCVYCCVDRAMRAPAQPLDVQRLSDELAGMLRLCREGEIFRQPPFDQTPRAMRRIRDIAFSGDGEPTLCPKFEEACDAVISARSAFATENVKIVLITNATLLHRPNVCRAVDRLAQHNAEVWAKLDAGTDTRCRDINRSSLPLSRVLQNIADTGRRQPIVIQSMFVSWRGESTSESELDEYLDRLQGLSTKGCRIKLVQVYTLARPTRLAGVSAVPAAVLHRIADRVRALGIAASVYPSPSEGASAALSAVGRAVSG